MTTSNLKPQTSNLPQDLEADLRMLLAALGWKPRDVVSWLQSQYRVARLAWLTPVEGEHAVGALCAALAQAAHADAGITPADLAEALFAVPQVLHDAAPITGPLIAAVRDRLARVRFKHGLHKDNFLKKYGATDRIESMTIGQGRAVLAELDARIAAAADEARAVLYDEEAP